MRANSFNPRTRTGCDTHFSNCKAGIVCVSTHAPARGATHLQSTDASRRNVSTHAPARGATYLMSLYAQTISMFQPTHPHGVRLDCKRFFVIFIVVSTHAPARGATPSQGCDSPHARVSTHAPARGATWQEHERHRTAPGFNPRTRTGCDPDLRHASRRGRVSTHAPARGATGKRVTLSSSITVSTHAPARGATSCLVWNVKQQCVSTHAPARGATSALEQEHQQAISFNPRTRTGCDE